VSLYVSHLSRVAQQVLFGAVILYSRSQLRIGLKRVAEVLCFLLRGPGKVIRTSSNYAQNHTPLVARVHQSPKHIHLAYFHYPLRQERRHRYWSDEGRSCLSKFSFHERVAQECFQKSVPGKIEHQPWLIDCVQSVYHHERLLNWRYC
jgi:hypothetical protein